MYLNNLDMKKINTLLIIATFAGLLSSCSSSQFGIRSATTYIELNKEDLQLSDRINAEAYEVRILGIDFSRLMKKESGNFDSQGYAVSGRVPVIGNSFNSSRVQNYALHNLLSANQDYDFVMYPRFEQKVTKVLFFYKKTETKVSARLGKL